MGLGITHGTGCITGLRPQKGKSLGFSALPATVLKFLTILSLNVCFISED